jgi:hypothetical protein
MTTTTTTAHYIKLIGLKLESSTHPALCIEFCAEDGSFWVETLATGWKGGPCLDTILKEILDFLNGSKLPKAILENSPIPKQDEQLFFLEENEAEDTDSNLAIPNTSEDSFI